MKIQAALDKNSLVHIWELLIEPVILDHSAFEWAFFFFVSEESRVESKIIVSAHFQKMKSLSL